MDKELEKVQSLCEGLVWMYEEELEGLIDQKEWDDKFAQAEKIKEEVRTIISSLKDNL